MAHHSTAVRIVKTHLKYVYLQQEQALAVVEIKSPNGADLRLTWEIEPSTSDWIHTLMKHVLAICGRKACRDALGGQFCRDSSRLSLYQ